MTTKLAIILTIAIVAVVHLLGCGGVLLLLDPSNSRDLEQAHMVGRGMGLLTWIPVSIVWIFWALRVRKECTRKK
ncbi:hypothetical protein M4951_05175 [Blastopirellula sp. J2-11]|uniref:hypothetical protein n=1 Tax=Blastopirellula sp. J2-11 TaxID=2943192 RepID=UPI0021C868D8|nr:hypothetical protein [Blastopirellula sp. J2-11]UUO07701.1 hypothetical protein M4951_05175 [Blastopirellula sp. J2-11]